MRLESWVVRVAFSSLLLFVSLSRGLIASDSINLAEPDLAIGPGGVDLDGDGIPDDVLMDSRCNC